MRRPTSRRMSMPPKRTRANSRAEVIVSIVYDFRNGNSSANERKARRYANGLPVIRLGDKRPAPEADKPLFSFASFGVHLRILVFLATLTSWPG
jgi:hypothetical protein